MRRIYQFTLSILVSFVIADWNNGFALNARLANLFTPFYDQHTQRPTYANVRVLLIARRKLLGIETTTTTGIAFIIYSMHTQDIGRNFTNLSMTEDSRNNIRRQ